MTIPYRTEGITDFTFNAGEISHTPSSDYVVTIHFEGADGHPGRAGSSGSSGSDGTRNSDGTQGSGGNGGDGSPGTNGTSGQNARNARLEITARGAHVFLENDGDRIALSGPAFIDAHGGAGGAGGNGGSGGSGGSGSPSGSRGRDGAGGHGGDGGDGGTIEVSAAHPHLLGLIGGINTSCGAAGAAGSGSPRGRAGRAGRDGSHVLRCNGVSGTRFGLRVTSVDLTHDGTACGGNLTRGSSLTLSAIRVENHGEFTIPAPFVARVQGSPGLEIENEVIANVDHSFAPRHQETLPSAVRITVARNVEVGRYRVRAQLESQNYAVASPLDEGHAPASFLIAVNHRVSDEALATLSPDDQRSARMLLQEAHAMPPESQSPYLLAALVTSFAPKEGLTPEQESTLAAGVDGALLSAERLFSAMKALATANARACEVIGADFVKSLTEGSKAKAIDLVLVLSNSDRVLTADEKARMRKVGHDIGMPDAWLQRNVPQLFVAGDTLLGSGPSNRPAAIALPFLIAGAAFAGSAFLAAHPDISIVGVAGFFTCVLLAATMIGYVLFFRIACAHCGSTVVEAVETGRGALVGQEDDHRCVACGARGTREKGKRAELLHSDTQFAQGNPWTRIYVATFVVVIAMAARFYAYGFDSLALVIGAGTVLLSSAVLSVVLLRTKRFSWILSSIALAVALVVTVAGMSH